MCDAAGYAMGVGLTAHRVGGAVSAFPCCGGEWTKLNLDPHRANFHFVNGRCVSTLLRALGECTDPRHSRGRHAHAEYAALTLKAATAF
jgi:hypothetical protein